MKRPYRNFPENADECASFGELKMCYDRLMNSYQECKRMKGATETALRRTGQSEKEAVREAKKVRKDLVTITKKQKAKEEASKAGYWSGGAAVTVALFYELCKAGNTWIGGAKFQEFWQHEAMVSTLTFMMTSMFAWAYKAMHPNSK